MRALITGIAIAAMGGPELLPGPQEASHRGDDPSILYFFLSPSATGGAEAARRAAEFVKGTNGRVRLRPVLLVQDFKSVGKVEEASPLYKTIKELQTLGTLDIPLYDEEGLDLAVRWEIRSVPTFVLVRRGQAHRALGPKVKVEELLECNR